VNPNALRYGATTGTVVIRWEGARQPLVWTVPPTGVDPLEAQRELARRYLRVFGPSTAASFTTWAGISSRAAIGTFELLGHSLTAVRTPIGDAWILAGDEPLFRADPAAPAPARLLPSGDAYFLLQGADRELLVPDDERRPQLWTPRVWPGAVLVDGAIRGVWRRAHDTMTVEPWGRFSSAERAAVEAEAAALPLPGIEHVKVIWAGG